MQDQNKFKSTDAQRRATANFTAKFDRVNVYMKKGYKDKIKSKYTNISISDYINTLIENDLNILPDKPDAGTGKNSACDPADIFINYPDKK